MRVLGDGETYDKPQDAVVKVVFSPDDNDEKSKITLIEFSVSAVRYKKLCT